MFMCIYLYLYYRYSCLHMVHSLLTMPIEHLGVVGKEGAKEVRWPDADTSGSCEAPRKLSFSRSCSRTRRRSFSSNSAETRGTTRSALILA